MRGGMGEAGPFFTAFRLNISPPVDVLACKAASRALGWLQAGRECTP
jgi:hypothetical protein